MRPIIDAHLDLAWCACSFDRDLTLSVGAMREREAEMTDELSRGRGTLTLPELRRSRMGLCVATVLARSGPGRKVKAGYKRTDLDYGSQSIAHSIAKGQLAYYRLLERQGELRFIRTAGELEAHWKQWMGDGETTPIGIVLSMEGADPVVDLDDLEHWWEEGLRAIGPAHYGRSHYAYGTGVDGPLGERGVELIKGMARLGMVLDVTHLSDESFREAVEIFDGVMWASHHNCRSLVAGDRQLADEQIRLLIEREAVIGVALDAWMLCPGWKRGETKPEAVSMEAVADHIDHVCQMAGGAGHSAIGSDLDGGFGTEQTPGDLDTFGDLHKLEGILERRGYSAADIDAIFYGNWLRIMGRALPSD